MCVREKLRGREGGEREKHMVRERERGNFQRKLYTSEVYSFWKNRLWGLVEEVVFDLGLKGWTKFGYVEMEEGKNILDGKPERKHRGRRNLMCVELKVSC